jgi:hypothetical protein
MLAMSFYNFFQPTAQPLTLGKHQGRRSLCAKQERSYPFSMGIRSTPPKKKKINWSIHRILPITKIIISIMSICNCIASAGNSRCSGASKWREGPRVRCRKNDRILFYLCSCFYGSLLMKYIGLFLIKYDTKFYDIINLNFFLKDRDPYTKCLKVFD